MAVDPPWEEHEIVLPEDEFDPDDEKFEFAKKQMQKLQVRKERGGFYATE